MATVKPKLILCSDHGKLRLFLCNDDYKDNRHLSNHSVCIGIQSRVGWQEKDIIKMATYVSEITGFEIIDRRETV